MFEYNYFYTHFGVRKPDQLVAPRISKWSAFSFPKESLFHYTGTGEPQEVGPVESDFIFNNITKAIYLAHVTELEETLGSPRRLPFDLVGAVRKHLVKNQHFRKMPDIHAALKDNQSLMVYSYCMLPDLYRYGRTLYTDYYRWINTETTLWKNVAKLANDTERHQFIKVALPTVLPSVADLNLGTGEVNQRIAKIFKTPESRFLLELWKWLGEAREHSILNLVSNDQLKKVNLIFEESGHWLVLNLGLLESWRNATREELKINPKGNHRGVDAVQLQKRILKMMMVLFENKTVALSEKDLKTAIADTKATKAGTAEVKPEIIKITNGPDLTKTVTVVDEIPENTGLDQDPLKDTEFNADLDQQIEDELNELEILNKSRDVSEIEESTAIIPDDVLLIHEAVTLEDSVKSVCEVLADTGMLSAAEYKRHLKLSETYKTLKAPDGRMLDKYIDIPFGELEIKESKHIPDIPTVFDKTMLKSSLLDFDRRYITDVLERDIAASVVNIQRAGISVTEYNVERVDDIMGAFNNYSVRIVPVEGSPSTLKFRLPVVGEDGVYVANGSKYRLRKQNGDLPIRKIAPDTVALTSYYGKVFVSRSAKRVYDYGHWLCAEIMTMALDETNSLVTEMQPGNSFNSKFICPRLYSTLGMRFRTFTVTPKGYPRSTGPLSYHFYFERKDIVKTYTPEQLAKYEKEGRIVVGETNKNQVLVMGKDNVIYLDLNDTLMPAITIETALELELTKAPREFAELRVLGKSIPIGLILAYEMGLGKLIKLLKVKYRRVDVGTRVNLLPDEFGLVFDDETLVFSREDEFASMILAGFHDYREAIRAYSVYDFDQKNVYLNVLDSKKIGIRYLRELDLLYQMFIDPITREILTEMNEPETFRGLLMRSCELLLTDDHPSEVDPEFMRKKGYERFAGVVYSEMVKSLRIHRSRVDRSRSPVEMNPHAVWMTISQDPSKILVSDINPVQNLKEMESVTFGGTGGRSARSMTKGTRIYHPNDMGTISESTSDSADVGINTYTSADPQFTSLRGLTKRYKVGETGATALLSTSALLAPGSDRDDPKRVNFIGIQNSHTVACVGYKPPMIRTGYEQVVAHRTGDLFAYSARMTGKITAISETGMTIQYSNGETAGIELGRRFGAAAGLTLPHEVVTDLKVGKSFKEGEVLAYNTGFFERDYLNPGNVVLKSGFSVKTALMESSKTFEDSSSISKKVAGLLTTEITYPRTIMVSFKDSVRRLVKVGEEVVPEDILCIIEDAVTAQADVFDESTLDTLRMLSAQSPQAKYKGTVERIKVYYFGEKEDMSETLKAIANAGDRDLSTRSRAVGGKGLTGKVDESFRVNAESLPPGAMAIQIYITTDVTAGTGDKGVFANQMKSVFCDVFEHPIVTETGVEIDAIFGQKSIGDRIVTSPELIGTTTTLLKLIGKKMVASYRNIK